MVLIQLRLSTEFANCTKSARDGSHHFLGVKNFTFILIVFLPDSKWSTGKKTRGTATDNMVNMSGIFKPQEECPQPRTVLIEGKPGMGKTTYCKKIVYDWATGKLEAEDCFPRFETVLLLKCRDMKSDLWEAIEDHATSASKSRRRRKKEILQLHLPESV